METSDLSTQHLTRMLYTEAGRAMLSADEADAYRAELLRRRQQS